MAAAIDPAGGRAYAVRADVGAEADVVRMVGECRERLGGLDILVNNAGIEKRGPHPGDAARASGSRSCAPISLVPSSACAKRGWLMAVQKRGGVVVNMSSVHEFIPWPGFAHYCASKGGMKLLTQTVAREWAPLGIRVLAIAPGAIATPINAFVLETPRPVTRSRRRFPSGASAGPRRSPPPWSGRPATRPAT